MNRHNKHIVFLLCLFGCVIISINLSGQKEKSFQWADQVGSKGKVIPSAIVCDSKDKVFITGKFADSLYFKKDTILCSGRYDMFIARYDKSGTQKWLWTAGGDGIESITCATTDMEDNLWFAGQASSGTHFGDTIVSAEESFHFLARIDKKEESSLIQIINSSNQASINRIAFDSEGHLMLGGSFLDTLIIGEKRIVSKGNRDIFLAIFDSKGEIMSLSGIGGEDNEVLTGLVYGPQNVIYLSGMYKSTFQWQSNKIVSKENGAYRNVFVAKIEEGRVEWLKTLNSPKHIKPTDLKANSTGDVYLGGNYKQELQVDRINLECAGQADIFIAKFDSDGTTSWVRQIGSPRLDNLVNMLVDHEDNLLITGSYTGPLQLGGNTLEPEGPAMDAFVALIGDQGQTYWSDKISGEGANLGRALAFDSELDLYISGTFRKSLKYDTTSLKSSGKIDTYLAKYLTCKKCKSNINAIKADKENICPDEELALKIRETARDIVWNNEQMGIHEIIIDQADTYTVQFLNEYGCWEYDTIVMADAPLPEFSLGSDTVVSVFDQVLLKAPNQYPKRQWSDFSTDLTMLARSSANTSEIQEIWLQVTDSDGCSNSDTIQVEFVQTLNLMLSGKEVISFYPNPVTDKLYWFIETESEGRLTVEMTDNTGKLVYQQDIPMYYSGELQAIDMQHMQPGIYLLSIKDGVKQITTSIVNQ